MCTSESLDRSCGVEVTCACAHCDNMDGRSGLVATAFPPDRTTPSRHGPASDTPPPGCRRAGRTGRPWPSARRACPISTTRRPSSTTIRSAIRTVEKRCDTRMVMRPSRSSSAHGGRVALEQRVLGLRVERGRRFVEHQHERPVAHEAARERELLPLAEAHLDAAGPRAARAASPDLPVSRTITSSAPARPTAVTTAGSSSRRGRSPTPTV